MMLLHKKLSLCEINSLVRECDVRWNSIEASLTLLNRKMTGLGFTFVGTDVVYPSGEELE